ncbi:MAG: hypothetical protein WAT20_15625 [Ferruginibacter sp.]|nr:hypothetical protein [Chitinophagaceae bacterium]
MRLYELQCQQPCNFGFDHPGKGFITMVTEEKIKQIRRQLSKGEPEGEIKNGLREEGYTADEIGTLFFDLYEKNAGTKQSKPFLSNNGQIYNLIAACFGIAGISMLVIDTWLTAYAIPCIVLGAISFLVKYFMSVKNRKK